MRSQLPPLAYLKEQNQMDRVFTVSGLTSEADMKKLAEKGKTFKGVESFNYKPSGNGDYACTIRHNKGAEPAFYQNFLDFLGIQNVVFDGEAMTTAKLTEVVKEKQAARTRGSEKK